MAIILRVSDEVSLDLTLIGSEEAVLLEANDSGVTLAVEESEGAALSVETDEATLDAETCIYVGGTGTPYSGSYEVTPKAYDEQILETAHKYLTQDVTVHEVPYYVTSNPLGETVYIASEVN